jgi:uncharacterized caspase-like protein
MAENNWAIVVGINWYEHLPPDDHLKYAVSDAMKVQEFLCEQAQFPSENVLLCCDSTPGVSPKQRPSRSGLRDLLLNQIQRAKEADNFWFFFAGHGIVHEHHDFLLPCDGNPTDLEATAIPISFVTDCLKDCGANNVVLVLDMCRNRTRSADEGSRAVGEEMGEQMGEQTLKIAKERGFVTLFSCERGQRSYEIAELQQGAFTYALLEGLKQSTTPRALEEYLRQRVPALNRQYGKPPQIPIVSLEPVGKYDCPLLLSFTPKVKQLKDQAKDAELKGDYALAESLWRQVIEAAQSTPSDRAEARKAIQRIDEKKQKPPPSKEVELKSERGVDYTKLRDLLADQKWEEADEETERVMLQAARGSARGSLIDRLKKILTPARQQEEGWLRIEDIDNFPCEDLRTINQLWVHHSKGHFGFSVQKEIYQSLSGTSEYNEKVWRNFGEQVGWRRRPFVGFLFLGRWWLSYSDLTFSLNAPEGHLPSPGWVGMGKWHTEERTIYAGVQYGGYYSYSAVVATRFGADRELAESVAALLSHRDL